MRKSKKTLAILAIIAMVLMMIPVQAFADTASATTRLAGDSRVDTAIAIANNGWASGASTVVVVPANDENLVDALAVAPLAKQLNAPVLITDKAGLDAKVAAEIATLKATTVYAVGALSDATVAQLKALSGVTVNQIKGADRFETAAQIAAKLTNPAGTFVVAYNGLADALSAASFAAANGYAIMVADTNGSLPASEKVVGSKTYTVGGQVAAISGATSFAGADRYATNDAVIKGLTFKYDKVYVANGETLVDALAGSVLAALTNSAIVLANTTGAAAAADVNANLSASSQVVAFGGTAVVPDAVKGSIAYSAPAALTVSSVSAINATTLEAVLGRAATADEQKAAKFSVTKTDSNNNTVTITMTATFSTDGTKVDLTTGGNLMKGTYTVKATAGASGSATVAVDDRKVGKIQILAAKMVQGADARHATVPYIVYDQYGADITKNALANNIQWTSSLGTAADGNDGVVTIDKGVGLTFTNTDTCVLTGIDGTSGVSASSNEAFSTAASVKSITFGTPILPSGKSNIETGNASAASIPVTVTDEFGNTIKNTAKLDGTILLTILSDGAYGYSNDADNNVLLNLNTAAVTDAKVITINLIEKATGKSFSTTVNVVKPAGPDAVAIGNFSSTVAVNDNSINIPLVVTDQFGNTISADDVAADVATPGVITVTSSNDSVIGTSDLIVAQGGSHKGNIVFKSAASVKAKGTTTITVYVNATGKSTSLSISTVDARVPATVKLDPAFKTTMIQGSTNSFAVTLYDQYGDQMSAGDVGIDNADAAGYRVTQTLVKQSGDTNSVTVALGANVTLTSALNYVTYQMKLAAASNLTGTYKLEVILQDPAAANLSEVDKSITVVKNNVTGLTYSITDIPTLAGDQGYTANSVTPEARKVKISAKDASGVSYAVPSSAIFNVTTSDATVASVGKDGSSWYVAGANISAGSDATKTATITVYVATDNGVQTFNKTVTVAKAAPVYQSIALVDTPQEDFYTMDPAAKTITDVNFASRAAAKTGTSLYAYGLDQYGIYTQLNNTAFTFADTGKVNSSVALAGTNGFVASKTDSKFELIEANAGDVAYVANKALYMTLFAGNGTATVKVTISTDDAITATKGGTRGGTDAGFVDAAETYTVTFTQALSAASQAAVIAQLQGDFTGVKGAGNWAAVADATHGSVVFNAAGTVATVTASGDVVAKTVAIPVAEKILKANVTNIVGTGVSADLAL